MDLCRVCLHCKTAYYNAIPPVKVKGRNKFLVGNLSAGPGAPFCVRFWANMTVSWTKDCLILVLGYFIVSNSHVEAG